MNDQTKAEVIRLARKGMTAEAIVERMNDQPTCGEYPDEDYPVVLSEVQEELDRLTDATQPWEMAKRAAQDHIWTPKVRKALEWSFNVGTAEDMTEETIRHNAQHISGGVVRGEDQDLDELVEHFKMRRTDADSKLPHDPLTIDDEWKPDDPQVAAELLQLITSSLSS